MNGVKLPFHKLYVVDEKGNAHEIKPVFGYNADFELRDGTRYSERLNQAWRNNLAVTVKIKGSIHHLFHVNENGREKALRNALAHAIKELRPSCENCKHLFKETHILHGIRSFRRLYYYCKVYRKSYSFLPDYVSKCPCYKRKCKARK